MPYIQWFADNGVSLDALAMTCGTDGFSRDKNNLMSVSLVGGHTGSDIGTVYIQGANPDVETIVKGKTVPLYTITGVTPDIYQKYAMPTTKAACVIRDAMQDVPFVLVYAESFMIPWFRTAFADIAEDTVFIDVIKLIKMHERGISIPRDVNTVAGLAQRITVLTSGIPSKGFGMEAVCERYIPGITGDTADAELTDNPSPHLECQVHRLWALWQAVLYMGYL